MASKKKHSGAQAGATFVEILVAGSIGLIVAGAVFYFLRFVSKGTQQMLAEQQLEQESSLISEVFIRTVRNGSFICIGNAATTPNADTNNIFLITIRGTDSSVVATFGIDNDSLEMNGNQFLTAYLCKFRNPLSHFKVFQNGKLVEFYLSMYKIFSGDTTFYTKIIGDVGCKN